MCELIIMGDEALVSSCPLLQHPLPLIILTTSGRRGSS